MLKTQSLPGTPGHFDGRTLFPGSYPAHRPPAQPLPCLAIPQWAPKACLAGSLPGPIRPVSPLCEWCHLPDLKLCLWPGLRSTCWSLLSPTLSTVRSGHPGCFPSSALVSCPSPQPTQTLSLPAACAQPDSAPSWTALQSPTSPVQDSDRPFLCWRGSEASSRVHTCAPSRSIPDNQMFGSKRCRTYPQKNTFGVLLNVSSFYFSFLQLKKSPRLPLSQPTT